MNQQIEGHLDKKFIMNIKMEGKFASYASVAKRLLTEEKAPQIQLSACGAATLYLLKVSSILSDFLPGLHKISFISYSYCHTCKNKKKQKGEYIPDKEEIIEKFKEKIGRSNLIHNCKDHKSFPILITFNQRLSFQDTHFDKTHPGYVKPSILPAQTLTFYQLIECYNVNEKLVNNEQRQNGYGDFDDSRSSYSSSSKSTPSFKQRDSPTSYYITTESQMKPQCNGSCHQNVCCQVQQPSCSQFLAQPHLMENPEGLHKPELKPQCQIHQAYPTNQAVHAHNHCQTPQNHHYHDCSHSSYEQMSEYTPQLQKRYSFAGKPHYHSYQNFDKFKGQKKKSFDSTFQKGKKFYQNSPRYVQGQIPNQSMITDLQAHFSLNQTPSMQPRIQDKTPQHLPHYKSNDHYVHEKSHFTPPVRIPNEKIVYGFSEESYQPQICKFHGQQGITSVFTVDGNQDPSWRNNNYH